MSRRGTWHGERGLHMMPLFYVYTRLVVKHLALAVSARCAYPRGAPDLPWLATYGTWPLTQQNTRQVRSCNAKGGVDALQHRQITTMQASSTSSGDVFALDFDGESRVLNGVLSSWSGATFW